MLTSMAGVKHHCHIAFFCIYFLHFSDHFSISLLSLSGILGKLLSLLLLASPVPHTVPNMELTCGKFLLNK